MFVVVGATGNTGSVVVETLLNRKQPVRVVVRSAEKGAGLKAKGAAIAIASLDDVSALTKVFEGLSHPSKICAVYSNKSIMAALWLSND